MNRHDRRASAAHEKKKQAHPTSSFADLVADAQLNRLKPFIAEQVQIMGANLARQQLAGQANVFTRLTVLERLAKEKLGETDETLAARTADEEDRALGFVSTNEPALDGNMVRVALKAYEDGQKAAEQSTRAVIRRLNSKPHQFHPDIEAALVGVKAGETKVVRVPTGSAQNEAGEEVKSPDLVFEVLVERVSVSTAPPRPPEEPSAPEAELQSPPTLEE